MSIYSEAKKAGIPMSSHESDLYLPAHGEFTETVADILNRHKRHKHTLFISQIDNELWYDIPFAYDPWWNARGMY